MKPAKKIILIGGSSGAYKLITQILAVIPNPITYAICILIHRAPLYSGHIESLLSNKHKRPILLAEDKMEILQNHIYFAPPSYHLLIEPNYTFSLDVSEPINFSIPSIDVLFETGAQIYQQNCTAFLLSGANTDGAKGLRIIEDFGGTTIVQDPTEAIIEVMPKAGLNLLKKQNYLSNKEIINYFYSL